jgi:site-specific DNA-methyltransferase (adenine-specific)
MKFPDKKYSVIYADPPWSYRQHGTGPKSRGNAAQHYHTMSTEDICALPIRQIMRLPGYRHPFPNAGGGQGCALFMWATFPQIADALRVMETWGFTYKTAAFVWVKKNRKSDTPFWGMGAYTRANAEICLLGVTPDFRASEQIKSHAVHQIIEAPVMEHSIKPDETRRRIVELLGDVPRIELFARQRVPGWDAWGDEIGD